MWNNKDQFLIAINTVRCYNELYTITSSLYWLNKRDELFIKIKNNVKGSSFCDDLIENFFDSFSIKES
jgi:hypothetical protein